MSAAPEPFQKKAIAFELGGSAEILYVTRPVQAEETLKALGMEVPAAEAAIIVAGSATPFSTQLENRLINILGRGVAQAAQDTQAILLDQGTKTGVSEILGQAVADRGRKTKLVGVVSQERAGNPDEPAATERESLDPNHTHYVLGRQNRPDWQAEMLCDLASAAAKNKDWILTVLVGGELDGPALEVVLETVRRNWLLVVIEGSGPLADRIVKLKKELLAREKHAGKAWQRINPFSDSNPLSRLQETDPRLYEILADGNIMIVSSKFDAIQLRNLIIGRFQPPREKILWIAWQRFAEYDQNSSRHRDTWRWLRNTPLFLGVISTLLVLIYSTTDLNPEGLIEGDQSALWAGWYTGFMGWLGDIISMYPFLELTFRFSIILLPIIASIALGVETRLKLGSKYILLRGAAESIKRGIYSYRVLNNHSKNSDIRLPFNAQDLAIHLENTNKILQDTDVNDAAYIPYGGPIPPNMFGAEEYDDGFSPLDPETYVRIRIGDQLKFFSLRTTKYERQIRSQQIIMLILGGTGTFLAAVGAQYWLPFTSAIISAMTAFLEYRQLEQILTKYNLTKASLENILARWQARSEAERKEPKAIQNLVREVEAILESENQGWVQYISQVQEGGREEGAPRSEEHIVLEEEPAPAEGTASSG